MAVHYDEVLLSKPHESMSTEELEAIAHVEMFIDQQILKNFDIKENKILIDLSVVDFEYDPIRRNSNNIPRIRKVLMRKELEHRYNKAGWNCQVMIQDKFEKSYFGGLDYMILTGKDEQEL